MRSEATEFPAGLVPKASTRRIRVLTIMRNFGVGGAETFLLSMLQQLDRNEFELAVLGIYGGGPLQREFERAGIRTFAMQFRGLADIPNYLRLVSLLRRERFDVVHTKLFHADIVGRLCARLAGVKAVFTTVENAHEWEKRSGAKQRLKAWLFRATAGVNQAIFPVSVNVRDLLRWRVGLPADKLALVYNGVDLRALSPARVDDSVRAELGIGADALVVGTVGSLNPIKNVGMLIDAAASVLAHRPDVYFIHAGKGDPEPFRLRARERGIESRVLFLGERRDIARILAALDVFTVTSLNEGISLALLEAMAMQRAVVVTDVGGNREIVDSADVGVCVPSNDAPALARELLRLLARPDERARLGARARERVQRDFNIERVAACYAAHYRDAAARRRLAVVSRAGWTWRDGQRCFQDNDGAYLDRLAGLFTRVDVICCERRGANMAGVKYGYSFTSPNVALHAGMEELSWRRPLHLLTSVVRTLRILARADVVYGFVNTVRGSLYTLIAAWALRKQTVAYNGTDRRAALQASGVGGVSAWARLALERLAMRAADSRIVTGPGLLDRYRHLESTWMAAPVSALFDFHACAPVERAPGTTLRLLTIAHLRKDKNVDVVLRACARLHARGVPFALNIVGDGQMRPALETLCKELGIAPSVTFHGYVSDPAQLARHYCDNDVLVFASTLEGFPRAVWEAIHFGLYVVLARVGGIELIFDANDMAILDRPDAVEFSDALDRAWRDPRGRLEAATAAQQKLQRLFPRTAAQQFQDCLTKS
jgi:glycosyltransferase involved in cell wall biosynthesis